MTMRKYTWAFAVTLAVFSFAANAFEPPKPGTTGRDVANPTGLDNYVNNVYPGLKWELVRDTKGDGWTGYVYKLTSGEWRKPEEVNRTVWEHFVEIVVPAEVKYDTAFFFITGGNNDRERPPGGADVMLRRIAQNTNAIAAQIHMIPNQPLIFSDEPESKKSEDAIIAYTWVKYMQTGDETWPLRMPMTAGVVRAMDMIQAECAKVDGINHPVQNFVVGGASKRGWTTWTTGAVDKRVIAICPVVIDCLNVLPSFQHHFSAQGNWAPAVDDYVNVGIMDWMGWEEFDALMKLVDPFSYRDRFKDVPKMLLNGSQDQFFLPDSSQFYWDELPGQKWIRYVPNAGHGLNASAVDTVESYFHSIISKTPMPEYAWEYADDNTLRVTTKGKPTAAKLWVATNPEARNFRLDVTGELYAETPLEAVSEGVYEVKVPNPEKGWSAYFIELTFPGPGEAPIRLTTPVKVVPDTYPSEFKRSPHPGGGFLQKK